MKSRRTYEQQLRSEKSRASMLKLPYRLQFRWEGKDLGSAFMS